MFTEIFKLHIRKSVSGPEAEFQLLLQCEPWFWLQAVDSPQLLFEFWLHFQTELWRWPEAEVQMLAPS